MATSRPIGLVSNVVTLTPGQQLAIADPTPLMNPLRTAMIINEIRFYGEFGSGSNALSAGVHLKCQLKLGNRLLTDGFVPVGLLSGIRNSNYSGLSVVLNESTPGEPSLTPHVWKLPKPLYVPAGEYIAPSFLYGLGLGFTITGTMRCQIGFFGYSLDASEPLPVTHYLPWVSQYISNGSVSAANVTEQSSENNLKNPYQYPLQLQKFVGRIQIGAPDNDYPGNTPPTLTQVQMSASDGSFIVKDKTPFDHLFSQEKAEWRVRSVLPPKSFIIVDLTENYSSLTLGGLHGMRSIRPVISMIGHHEVPYGGGL